MGLKIEVGVGKVTYATGHDLLAGRMFTITPAVEGVDSKGVLGVRLQIGDKSVEFLKAGLE